MQLTSTDLGLAARVQQLTKTYGAGASEVRALDGVSVGIRRGEFTAIMGPSGSGKSTLMHIMAGLDAATSGRAWIGDTDITGLSDLELTILRRGASASCSRPSTSCRRSTRAATSCCRSTSTAGGPTALERARIDGLIDTLGLADRLRHRPHQLSGGQQQRVAIARALATAPDLVFADEPTGNLDSRSGREVLRLLAAASRDHGQSIAMVTHDPVAASHADRVIFLADGRVVADKPRPERRGDLGIHARVRARRIGRGMPRPSRQERSGHDRRDPRGAEHPQRAGGGIRSLAA